VGGFSTTSEGRGIKYRHWPTRKRLKRVWVVAKQRFDRERREREHRRDGMREEGDIVDRSTVTTKDGQW
jgi:hypothetical protein